MGGHWDRLLSFKCLWQPELSWCKWSDQHRNRNVVSIRALYSVLMRGSQQKRFCPRIHMATPRIFLWSLLGRWEGGGRVREGGLLKPSKQRDRNAVRHSEIHSPECEKLYWWTPLPSKLLEAFITRALKSYEPFKIVYKQVYMIFGTKYGLVHNVV